MYVETKLGKLPVYYGMTALAKFSNMAGISIDDAKDKGLVGLDMYQVFMFVYVGFLEGARKEGEKCQIKSVDEMGDMIEENPEIITQVMSVYSEHVKSTIKGEDGKKK